MNRWVLLEHKVPASDSDVADIHYDLLIEGKLDCLTWQFKKIPSINKGFFEVRKQPNHRLVWLSRIDQKLSNNRGLVKRIDHGTFINLSHAEETQETKLILNGKLLNGLFTIAGNFCQLTKNN